MSEIADEQEVPTAARTLLSGADLNTLNIIRGAISNVLYVDLDMCMDDEHDTIDGDAIVLTFGLADERRLRVYLSIEAKPEATAP